MSKGRRVVQTLSDDLRAQLPGLAPCPQVAAEKDMSRGSLLRATGELQDWLRHVLLYPDVKHAAGLRRFLLDGPNTRPMHMELQGEGSADYDQGVDDDMEMDDLFDR
jgi:hypothetical protein